MLILTRKIGEIIHIGDNIRVIVKAVSGKTVRLGVMAPSDIPIYREELLKAPDEPTEPGCVHNAPSDVDTPVPPTETKIASPPTSQGRSVDDRHSCMNPHVHGSSPSHNMLLALSAKGSS